MSSERWFQAPRRLPLLLLPVTLVPVVALAWLTLQLVEKDRRLETQQVRDRVEQAADRIVAASHQRLAELESHLRRLASTEQDTPPDHTAKVSVEGDRVTVSPAGALVYYPILSPRLSKTAQLPLAAFAEGERYEHQEQNPLKAIDWFDALARSEDPVLRAGALLRLGRNQKKARQIDAALATYEEMTTLGTVDVDGFPAAVLALAARCSILERAGRPSELKMAARTLRAGLSAGAWPILRDTYDLYAGEARRWTGDAVETETERNARAVAAAFQSTYERWLTEGKAPQRQWFIAEGRPVLLASAATPRRLVALVAGPEFLEDAWKDVRGVHVLLTDGEGRPILGAISDGAAPAAAVRTTDTSQLPWTVKVTGASLEADQTEAARRRQLLLAGLAMVLLLIGGSAYFTLRGVGRELALARLQSDFVSAVSHEFRTPLASLRHLSDMLSKGRISDEGQRQQSYDFLSRESERLEKLVEELLDFGRLEGGAYRYRFASIDLAKLVRGLVHEFQEQVSSKGYRIELADRGTPALVLADREALSRAIWNLLDNAVKYSPGSDTVWVDLTVESGAAVILVRDRGLGIALSEQKEIFEKFVRGSNARAEQIKGTGIGLAMVRHIVEAHHGEVRVESAPNQGSTFALVLPIEEAA